MTKLNKPNKVILHCAASPDTKYDKVVFSFEDCKRYHVEERGWNDIGYQYYIERDGSLHQGRDEGLKGAHTLGQNHKSIGVCYEGSHFPSVSQIETLCYLFKRLKNKYGFGPDDWYPHNKYANKQCPGFDMEPLKELFDLII